MDNPTLVDKIFSLFEGDSPVLQFIGEHGYKIYEERELILMYIHLLISALFPIYIGSHASLRRPPSAKATVRPKQNSAQDENEEEDEDDDLDKEVTVEGLSPSDAIVFPVLAGLTLGGLYFVIKVLKNATLLNKILGWYFSIIGVFGVGKLAADSLNVVTTFIFPSSWSSGGTAYYVYASKREQATKYMNGARVEVLRQSKKNNPFPGYISTLHFPESVNKVLWTTRALLKSHWIFRGYFHGVFSVKSKVLINDVLGFIIGLAMVVLYNTNNKPWWLTNLIGFGFCYGTLQLMSPTTFWTGTLILAGLFIYDITMVFYTPLMVTVATSLDVPIKLVFPGPKRGGMLGLGDVVLPGIMMAIALRFDLYLHYLRQQRTISPNKDSANDKTIFKVEYQDATRHWGEKYWTNSVKGSEDTVADGMRFKKTYFHASVVGYLIGMLVTLVVLNVYNHAQPALLYLVPGVLLALWGTALVRGERTLMWEYTEDGSLDDTPTSKDEDGEEAVMSKKKEPEKTEKGKEAGELQKKKHTEHAHHVFLFSLSEPKRKQTIGGNENLGY